MGRFLDPPVFFCKPYNLTPYNLTISPFFGAFFIGGVLHISLSSFLMALAFSPLHVLALAPSIRATW